MDKKAVVEIAEIWIGQHGNKKNADVKRLITIIESVLSNDTVKNALYLGAGVLALKIILDFVNEHYAIKCEAELEKINIEHENKDEPTEDKKDDDVEKFYW